MRWTAALLAFLLAAPVHAQQTKITGSSDCKKSGVACNQPPHESVRRGLLHPDSSDVHYRAQLCVMMLHDQQEHCMELVPWRKEPKSAIPDGWVAAPPVYEDYVPHTPVTVCIGLCIVNPR